MESLTEILPHISGLPWTATFALILFTLACSRGIDALLKWRKARLDERQYDDGQTTAGYQALIGELKTRILKLETDFHDVIGELKDSRAAHSKCEVEQERLRGQINLLQEKVAALERHDKVNAENVKALKQIAKEIDPQSGAKLP